MLPVSSSVRKATTYAHCRWLDRKTPIRSLAFFCIRHALKYLSENRSFSWPHRSETSRFYQDITLEISRSHLEFESLWGARIYFCSPCKCNGFKAFANFSPLRVLIVKGYLFLVGCNDLSLAHVCSSLWNESVGSVFFPASDNLGELLIADEILNRNANKRRFADRTSLIRKSVRFTSCEGIEPRRYNG